MLRGALFFKLTLEVIIGLASIVKVQMSFLAGWKFVAFHSICLVLEMFMTEE
jgi:hypothetical protein